MRKAWPLLTILIAAPVLAQSDWTGVASEYRKWTRLGDERPSLGPLDCPFHPDGEPPEAQPRRSSADLGAHSRKAFFLYVSDAEAYRRVVRQDVEPTEGLTVVKEAFVPADLGPRGGTMAARRPMPTPSALQRDVTTTHTYRPRVIADRLLGVGEPVGLFVMRYSGGRWRFATVRFDGTVESSGAMSQCVGCHDDAPHRGLFGLESDRHPSFGVRR